MTATKKTRTPRTTAKKCGTAAADEPGPPAAESSWLISLAGPPDAAAARLALVSDLLAARAGARSRLRLADDGVDGVDAAAVVRDLSWLGIAIADDVVRTSGRAERYAAAADALGAAGLTETNGDVARLRVAPGRIAIDDAILGQVTFDRGQLGEIVVSRAGRAGADLGAAVDHAELGPPIVVRDRRELERTARELLLLDALGLPAPRYAHLGPLLPAAAGEELPTLGSLRRAGYLPGVVADYLGGPSWSPAAAENRAERAARFSLAALAHGPVHFDPGHLRAANGEALRALPRSDLATLIAAAMQRARLLEDPIPDAARRWIETFVDAFGDRFATLSEALAAVADLRAEAVVVPALELERLRNRQAVFYLDAVGQYVDAQPELRGLPLDHDLPAIAAEFGIGHDDAFAALRMALTGTADGPPLGPLFALLGHDRILIRIGAISSHLLHGRGLEPIKYGPGGVPFQTIVAGGPPPDFPPG